MSDPNVCSNQDQVFESDDGERVIAGENNAATTATLAPTDARVRVYQPVSGTTVVSLPPIGECRGRTFEIHVEKLNSNTGGGDVEIADQGDTVGSSAPYGTPVPNNVVHEMIGANLGKGAKTNRFTAFAFALIFATKNFFAVESAWS